LVVKLCTLSTPLVAQPARGRWPCDHGIYQVIMSVPVCLSGAVRRFVSCGNRARAGGAVARLAWEGCWRNGGGCLLMSFWHETHAKNSGDPTLPSFPAKLCASNQSGLRVRLGRGLPGFTSLTALPRLAGAGFAIVGGAGGAVGLVGAEGRRGYSCVQGEVRVGGCGVWSAAAALRTAALRGLLVEGVCDVLHPGSSGKDSKPLPLSTKRGRQNNRSRGSARAGVASLTALPRLAGAGFAIVGGAGGAVGLVGAEGRRGYSCVQGTWGWRGAALGQQWQLQGVPLQGRGAFLGVPQRFLEEPAEEALGKR
jgi:hypothetical protein